MSTEVTRWSVMDEALLKCAANHMSPQQMETELDIPAAEAAVRVRQLLRSRDIWTEVEERQLLLVSLYDLKRRVEQNLDLDNPKSVEALTKILDLIGKRLDTVSSITESELEKVTTVQARKLVQLIALAFDHAETVLAQMYPEAFVAEVHEAFQEGLRAAAGEIEPA